VNRETTPSAERKQSVARNPKATYDYHVLETWETGIVLTGTEVKSLRSGKASIKEAYARVRNGEVFLEGMNITPYEQGNRYNHDPVRSRKLLLHRKEIQKLIGAVEQRGLTLVPLELYFKNGRAKIALALGKRYAQDAPLDWGCAAPRTSRDVTRLAEAGHTLRAKRGKRADDT